jgi:hypothetical protein
MRLKFLTIGILIISCNSVPVNKRETGTLPANDTPSNKLVVPTASQHPQENPAADTTSSGYLIYLLNHEMPLNLYWTQQLANLDAFTLPLDTLSRLSVIREAKINDSIGVVILSHAGGNSYDEYLLTVKNKKAIVSGIHIKDAADSDLSPDNPYYYSEYQLMDDKHVKVFSHKITGTEGGVEKDSILSVENWVIRDDGTLQKK